MSFKRLKLSLESLDESQQEEVMPATAVVETEEESSQTTAVIDASFVEVGSAMESIDEAFADSQKLDVVADTMQNMEQAGGMDANSAVLADMALEHLYAKLGVKKSPLLAMETYSSEKTRKGATALALESIQETAKKVWEAIKVMLKKAVEFVKNFFAAVFDKNTKVANKAKAMLEELKKFKEDNKVDDSILDKKIENQSVAAALNIDGKVNFSCIEDGFASIEVFLKAAKETTESLKGHLGLVHGFLSKITEKDLDDNFAMPGLDKLGWKEYDKGLHSFGGVKTIGFNNSSLYIHGYDTEKKDAVNYDVEILSGDTSDVSKELDTLSLDEIEKALGLVIQQSAEIEKSKSVVSELEDIQKSLEKESDDISAVLSDIKEKANIQVAKKAITVISKLSISINTIVSKYAISSSQYVLQYIDLCMKEHGIAIKAPVSA